MKILQSKCSNEIEISWSIHINEHTVNDKAAIHKRLNRNSRPDAFVSVVITMGVSVKWRTW